MKYKLSIITFIIICTLLFLSGCSNNPIDSIETPGKTEGEITIGPTIEKKDKFTLLIYMCGNNLESKYGEASKNILEMQEAEISENTNVVIQTGGSKSWKDISISAQSSDRFLIETGGKKLVDRNVVRQNMGLSQTLIDFIDYGVKEYPAENYGLIFWNHGSGSIKGVCFDSNFDNDGLTLPEIKEALASTQSIINKKFEFVGFDACLMATYDMASILKPYANYMIASEELEPSSGWDYKTLISKLDTINFYDDVLNGYALKQSSKATYTLSAINLDYIEKVDEVIEKISEQINYDVSFLGNALTDGLEFGSRGNGSHSTNLFDLGVLANKLGISYDFSSFIKNVNGTTRSDATGISLYFPTEQEQLLTEYEKICQNETYMNFLVAYFYYQPKTTIEFINYGYDNNGQMSFVLTDESKKFIQEIGYELHNFIGSKDEQLLYCLGTDDDVSFSNGVYTIDFDGNWVFLNDHLLHTHVYEEEDEFTFFSTEVKINGELCQLLFNYYKPTHKIEVEGYIVEDDLTSRINSLETGMEITIIYEDSIHDDNIIYYNEAVIIWNDQAKLAINKVNEGYYQYIPYIIDIYGDIFYGSTAIIYFDGASSKITDIAAG